MKSSIFFYSDPVRCLFPIHSKILLAVYGNSMSDAGVKIHLAIAIL